MLCITFFFNENNVEDTVRIGQITHFAKIFEKDFEFLLQIQISAYLDNVFDVAALMEDSETKTAALERVAELEDELSHVSLVS